MENYRIAELVTIEEMLKNYDLLAQLSPQVSREAYESMVNEMKAQGYRMVGVFDGERCIGMSGFWIATKFYSGKYIELDNVVIDKDHRGRGVGKLLCDWVVSEGRKAGCQTAMLDAYVENKDAHRFYFREGFVLRGFHFLQKL